MSFLKYPSSRGSGMNLYRSLPGHWSAVRLKNVLKQRITDGPHVTPIFEAEGVPFLSVDGIQDGELQFEGCRYISEASHAEYRRKAFPRREDLLLGKAASTGKIARVKVDFEFSIWSPLALIRVNQEAALPAYIEYALKCPVAQAQIDNLCTANTQKNISMDDIPRIVLALPPIDEQRSIVSVLDHETTKIDALVGEQRHLIELLKEKRQAVISQAVTKGLQPGVLMKASGLKWLGEVPAHWTFARLKALFRQAKRQGYEDKEILSVYREFGVILKDSRTDNFNKTPDDVSSYQLVQPGDLVVNKMKAWQGSLGISPLEGITSPDYLVFLPLHSELPAYFHLLLRSRNIVSTYLAISNGIRVAQWRLEPEEFLAQSVCIPPIEEQHAIVEFVDEQMKKWSDLITEAEGGIELLSQRRSALISAAVTGKIDVRNWQKQEELEPA